MTHLDSCTGDDPIALALLGSQRRRRLEIVCPSGSQHPLAAVFEIPGTGRVLAQPAFTGLADYFEQGDVMHGRSAEVHLHAALTPLDELVPDEQQHGRCRCGTFAYTGEEIAARLELPHGHRHDNAVPYMCASPTGNNRAD